MKISELIEEIRVLRLVDVERANELEERTLGRASKDGRKPEAPRDDAPDSMGVLL